MAHSDTEFEAEIRSFTGIDDDVVDSSDFQTVLDDAKRHIQIRRSLVDEEIDWYGDQAQEEALNWTTKLFLKVAAGELDSQTVQVGAIDHDTLLAKDDNAVTIWFRNMRQALGRVKPQNSYGISSSERRTYSNDEFESTTSGINTDL